MNVDMKQSAQPYLDDAEVKRLIALAQAGDMSARDRLVQSNIRLVWSVVQRFMNRGYEPDVGIDQTISRAHITCLRQCN